MTDYRSQILSRGGRGNQRGRRHRVRVAASPGVPILGRGLLGVGTAGSLVASLAVYTRRFPPDRFATLTGRRNSFLVVGAFTLLVDLLIAVVVKDDAPSARGAASTTATALLYLAFVGR